MSAIQQLMMSYGSPIVTGWFAGVSMLRARYGHAAVGTPTASIVAGGYTSTDATYSSLCDSFNGTAWSATGALLGGRRMYLAGCGTQSAALAACGFNWGQVANAETYNGTSWTSVAAVAVARSRVSACGTSAAAIIAGGFDGSNYYTTAETFNGTAWSAGGSLTTLRGSAGLCGTSSAAVCSGGSNWTGGLTSTELYNGTTWSSSGAMTQAAIGQGQCGTQSAARAFGGYTPNWGDIYANVSETFNGTVWASSAYSLASNKALVGGCGSATAAQSTGGTSGAALMTVENFA